TSSTRDLKDVDSRDKPGHDPAGRRILIMAMFVIRIAGMRTQMIVLVIMIVIMPAAADVVVMPLLRGADGVLVADDAGAVLAELAVHRRVAIGKFPDAVEKGVDHFGVVAQVGRLDELDTGKARRHGIGLIVNA